MTCRRFHLGALSMRLVARGRDHTSDSGDLELRWGSFKPDRPQHLPGPPPAPAGEHQPAGALRGVLLPPQQHLGGLPTPERAEVDLLPPHLLEHHGLDRRAQILGWRHDSEPNRTVIQRPEGRDPQRHLVRGRESSRSSWGSSLAFRSCRNARPDRPSAIVATMSAYQSIYRAKPTRLGMKIRTRCWTSDTGFNCCRSGRGGRRRAWTPASPAGGGRCQARSGRPRPGTRSASSAGTGTRTPSW